MPYSIRRRHSLAGRQLFCNAQRLWNVKNFENFPFTSLLVADGSFLFAGKCLNVFSHCRDLSDNTARNFHLEGGEEIMTNPFIYLSTMAFMAHHDGKLVVKLNFRTRGEFRHPGAGNIRRMVPNLITFNLI